MASIHKERRGDKIRYRVQFYDKDNRRRSIRLGNVNKKSADSIRAKVEDLLSASIAGCRPSSETTQWLTSQVGEDMAAKLRRAGFGEFVPERRSAKLGEFLDQYIEGRKADAANSTVTNFGQLKRILLESFAKDCDLRSISPGDADDWRQSLVERYSIATVSKLVKRAKQVFRAAERKGLLDSNPFADLVGGSEHNESRMRFVDRETIEKVIAACPDAEWRAIVSLARFGGLRVPSELVSLRWEHVNWEQKRITVMSPKTKKQGKPWRIVPLFPEVESALTDLQELTAEGAEYVFERYRDRTANLRTQFGRILARAGVEPWPRLFQNLRASRETELANDYPLHVVTGWLGNTPRVADRHYLSTTEEHFRRAVSSTGGATGGANGCKVVQQVVPSASASYGQPVTETKKAPQVAPTHGVTPEALDSPLVPPLGLEPRTY